MSQFVSSRWSLRAVGGKDSTGQTQGGWKPGEAPQAAAARGALPGALEVTAGLQPARRTLPSNSGTGTGSGPASGMAQRRAGAPSQPDPPGPRGGCLSDSGCAQTRGSLRPVPPSLSLCLSLSVSPPPSLPLPILLRTGTPTRHQTESWACPPEGRSR